MLKLGIAQPNQGVCGPDAPNRMIAMKYTQYYLHRRKRKDRQRITDEWVRRATRHPLFDRSYKGEQE